MNNFFISEVCIFIKNIGFISVNYKRIYKIGFYWIPSLDMMEL